MPHVLDVRAMPGHGGFLHCVLLDLHVLERWLSLDLLCRYIAHGRGTLREDRCREHGDSDERGCDFRKHDNLLK
jgi:hypothetical protein